MNLFFLVFQSQLSLQCVMLQEEMWKSWGAKKLLEEIKANNLRGCYSIFRIPSTCKKKNRHVKDVKNFYFHFFQKQFGPHLFKLGNFKFPVILNLKTFPVFALQLFSISYFPTILNYFTFLLRVQNYRFSCISL